MTRTIKVWKVMGASQPNPGSFVTYFAATPAECGAIVREYEIMEPIVRQIEVAPTRYGIALALQNVVDDLCANED